MIILLSNVVAILLAIFIARKDAAITYPFRQVYPNMFPGLEKIFSDDKKLELLKVMHFYNGFTVILVASVIGALVSLLGNFYEAAICSVNVLFLYWALFDPLYAKGIGEKDIFFLGSTAKLDRVFYGKGKIKAYICLFISIALNSLIIFKVFS